MKCTATATKNSQTLFLVPKSYELMVLVGQQYFASGELYLPKEKCSHIFQRQQKMRGSYDNDSSRKTK